MFDRGMAGRQRAFRHGLAGFLGHGRQAPLLAPFGAGGGGVDIRRSRILCNFLDGVQSRVLRGHVRPPQAVFGTLPRGPWPRPLGVIGLVAFHRPKLSVAVGYRQRGEWRRMPPRWRRPDMADACVRNAFLRMRNGGLKALTTL